MIIAGTESRSCLDWAGQLAPEHELLDTYRDALLQLDEEKFGSREELLARLRPLLKPRPKEESSSVGLLPADSGQAKKVRVSGLNTIVPLTRPSTVKRLISECLEKLRKKEEPLKGTAYRRSSLTIDHKGIDYWFEARRPTDDWFNAPAPPEVSDIAVRKLLFDEVKHCRDNEVDFARKVLAGLMLEYPELLGKYAARSVKVGAEEFKYYHHAQMVLNQFIDYFLDDKGPGADVMSEEIMVWMILYHDMDKVLSIDTFGNDGEHDLTVETMREYGGKEIFGFAEPELLRAWRMVSMDPLGEYFKGAHGLLGEMEKKNKMAQSIIDRMGPEHPVSKKQKMEVMTPQQEALEGELVAHVIQQIVDIAALAEIPAAQDDLMGWFQRYLQFYQCDFSSYHVDSKYGDDHFDKKSEKKSQGRINGPDSFNPPYFGPDDGGVGDPKSLLIPKVAGIAGGSRLKFRMSVHDKAAVRLVQAFSSGEPRVPQPPKDVFSTLMDLRSRLVQERKRMNDRTAKIPVVDFRHVLAETPPCALERLQQLMAGVEAPAENDPVLQQFNEDGVFIRKLVAIPANKTVREDLENGEFWKLSEKVVKESVTPWVLPSTLVVGGIPTNLTNAGVELLHCSGLIYDMDTPMAPSTKEHSESARLSTALNQTIQKRIHEGFGHDKWLGIVRATIQTKGGKTYEDRASLVQKLREMEFRRSGQTPDKSTKELLYDILKFGAQEQLEVASFQHALEYWEESENNAELPKLIVDQLSRKYLKVFAELGPEKSHAKDAVLGKLIKVRMKRDHTIYDGSDRGLQTGNRYNVSDKGPRTEMGSSEADGFDGHTFKTNEVLLLPDGYDRIIGIYLNRYSFESLVHGINLAKEVHAQTGRQLGLYTYSAFDGVQRIRVDDVLREILDRRPKAATLESDSLVLTQGPTTATPTKPPQEPGEEMTHEEKVAVLNEFLKAKGSYFPDVEPAKDRG